MNVAATAGAPVRHSSMSSRVRVVAAQPDAGPRGDPGPALADEDRTGVYRLAGVDLHAQHLRLGIATVAGGTPAFLVCHLPIYRPALVCARRASASLPPEPWSRPRLWPPPWGWSRALRLGPSPAWPRALQQRCRSPR